MLSSLKSFWSGNLATAATKVINVYNRSFAVDFQVEAPFPTHMVTSGHASFKTTT